MPNDLLEATSYGSGGPPNPASTESTNLLIRELIREIRKMHPSQRCVVKTEYNNGATALNGIEETARCTFLSSGKPVKAQYLVVSNNTAEIVNLGLNEPVAINAAETFSTGVKIAAGATFQLPVEIEAIYLRLTSQNSGRAITINGGPTGVGVNGTIQVYAYTIPNSDKDETE